MKSELDFAEMLSVALEEARKGLAEGGIPVGAAIFNASGQLVGAGHNRRVQNGDPSMHGETDAFRNAGRQLSYRDLIMVTTLAPCWYCSGLLPAIRFRHFGGRREPEFSGRPRLAALARRASDRSRFRGMRVSDVGLYSPPSRSLERGYRQSVEARELAWRKRTHISNASSGSCSIAWASANLPDAADYGDVGRDTLGHIARSRPLHLPNLVRLGLANIKPLEHLAPPPRPIGNFGKGATVSPGKDTTTGHWEMAGIWLDQAFPVYPHGFPPELIAEFERRIGRRTLGNKPASGTEIIKELGEEHVRTGFPIVYTSGDSVFQIAAHEDVVPIAELYRMCEIARALLDGPNRVGRVIARPFTGPPEISAAPSAGTTTPWSRRGRCFSTCSRTARFRSSASARFTISTTAAA